MASRRRLSPWTWLLVAALGCLVNGLMLWDAFGLDRGMVPDFYQEYASARNFELDVPIYTRLPTTLRRDTSTPWFERSLFVEVNAHPPSSVLLAIPFARLPFEQAFPAWNVVSLAGLVVALGIVGKHSPAGFPRWCWSPLLVLFLTSNPLRQQIRQGQLNLILLPLLTGSWAALRTGRPALAGSLLGAAAAIKLYPAYLIVYFLWRRRLDVVVPAVGCLLAITGLTAWLLGLETYRAYLTEVIPAIGWFRIGWNNASVLGFWSRLFDPSSDVARWYWYTDPLWRSPTSALLATWACDLAITLALAWATRRGQRQRGEGPGFALAVVAMLLVTPVTWEHYMVLLLVPFVELLAWWSPRRRDLLLISTIVIILWVDPTWFWDLFLHYDDVARPVHSLLLLALPFYALVALFWLLMRAVATPNRMEGGPTIGHEKPAPGLGRDAT